ncbi:hypothetical protein VTN96DRAFT_7035 [Rasamsonia emersonii]
MSGLFKVKRNPQMGQPHLKVSRHQLWMTPKEGKRVRRAPGRDGALFWQELIGQERTASTAQSPRASPKLDVRRTQHKQSALPVASPLKSGQ